MTKKQDFVPISKIQITDLWS